MPKFTNAELDEARGLINAALSTLKEKGLNVKIISGITYGDEYFSCKIQAVREGGLSKEQSFYDKNHHLHSLPKRGAKIAFNGKKYEIYGWNTRARKNKILLTGLTGAQNGKRYHASMDQVRLAA